MNPSDELNRKHEELLDLMTALTKEVGGLTKEVAELREEVQPSVEAFKAWITLGGWGKTFLYIVGAILGLILTWRQVFPNK